MSKGKKRKHDQAKKAYRRSDAYQRGGGGSKYARKCAWLNNNYVEDEMTGARKYFWGFEVPEPKPWK